MSLKWCASLLPVAASFVLMPAVNAQTAPGNDWAQACMQQLVTREILPLYTDGTLRPGAAVTRAEFAAIAQAAFDPTDPETSPLDPLSWSTEYGFLAPLAALEPQQPISRLEALVALANGLGYDLNPFAVVDLSQTFVDVDYIPAGDRPLVAAATQRRIVVNAANPQRLDPYRLASRAEVASFICQAMVGVLPGGLVPQRYVAQADVPELRGVWLTNIDSEVLFSRESLTEAVTLLRQLNFNTLYPTVWNWGYTLYPSQVAEQAIARAVDPDPRLQGWDMLQTTVELARQQGMSVIPWFEFGFMTPSDSALAYRNPEWLTNRRDGSRLYQQGRHERVWLNPFHPEVQDFILNLVVEVVTKYDVDGIQFDDHFGLPVEMGYDPYTVALYRQEHNGQDPPSDPHDPAWVRWRADKLTAFVERLFRAVKRNNPKAILSLAPNPYHFAYPMSLQDWKRWQELGYVEELIVQVYRSDNERFLYELTEKDTDSARQHVPVAIGILTGLRGQGMPMNTIDTQVQAARNRGYAGVSFFFYESMWHWSEEPKDQRQQRFELLFPTPADRPELDAAPAIAW
ncbi:MAG: family 10 glycosylhydrolase [Coleofasciculaceae cyanobacterium SM2_3_26]|nr:family 10 glycosylhydrolase [Coleofasciculaceae cyanobacterium SM2_3_26]